MAKVTSKGKASGSGFVVALRDGFAYVVTGSHVVGADAQVSFYVNLDRTYPATVRNAEPETDEKALAVLRVANPPNSVVVVPPATEPISVPGTRVEIGGFPASLGGVFVPLDPTATRAARDLILSVQTPPGYSGGPVIRNDAVVGMVYGWADFGRALGVASLRDFLDGNGIEWGSAAVSSPRQTEQRTATPEWKAGEKRVNPKDGLTYVWIPRGKFTMGCSRGDSYCRADELPAHEVILTNGFWIGQTEVTQAAYEKVIGANPSFFEGANRPVERVTSKEALAYCRTIGLRLPSEAEWEYAARAGVSESRYSLMELAWCSTNSGSQTRDVAGKQPNGWGLYDMLGNVSEWVNDWYDAQYYRKKVQKDPMGPSNAVASRKVVRGGSWRSSYQALRISDRGADEPSSPSNYYGIGFRCAGDLR